VVSVLDSGAEGPRLSTSCVARKLCVCKYCASTIFMPFSVVNYITKEQILTFQKLSAVFQSILSVAGNILTSFRTSGCNI